MSQAAPNDIIRFVRALKMAHFLFLHLGSSPLAFGSRLFLVFMVDILTDNAVVYGVGRGAADGVANNSVA